MLLSGEEEKAGAGGVDREEKHPQRQSPQDLSREDGGQRGRERWLSGVVDRTTEGKRRTQCENGDKVGMSL